MIYLVSTHEEGYDLWLLGSVLATIAIFYMMVIFNALSDAPKSSKKELYWGYLKMLLAFFVGAIGVLMMCYH